MAYKILLVEDDLALAMGTEYALQSEGYEVLRAGTLKQAQELLDPSVDLLLLDVMLPDGSGYDFCKSLRRNGIALPIIFLTALSEEVNIVQGLDLGADDYVSKPYRVKELLSRIAAALRRCKKTSAQETLKTENLKSENSPSGKCYRFGNKRFFPETFRLYDGDTPVECTASELKLLRELIANEGKVLSRTLLLERLFDTEEVYLDDNTLSVYLKRLRDKLGEDARCIETVRGVGYRFVISK